MILYDGGCALCRSSVAWLARRSRGRIGFVASGDVQPEDYGLDRSDLEAWVWFVHPGSPAVAGAAVVSRALRTCGPFWSAVGVLLSVPPVSLAARVAYRLVAANRHRFDRSRTFWPAD